MLNTGNCFININSISKSYNENNYCLINAVNDVSIKINEGEIVAIAGPSGSGKSTLLSILGGMLKPNSGNIVIDSINITTLSQKQLTKFRLMSVGFVFQTFRLLDSVSVLDNVLLPIYLAKKNSAEDYTKAKELLIEFGIGSRMQFMPQKLSGGEKQRVAIARALINNPKLILADEPTGSLDSKNGQLIIETLCNISRKENKTVIIVSHDERILKHADKVYYMEDGCLKRN